MVRRASSDAQLDAVLPGVSLMVTGSLGIEGSTESSTLNFLLATERLALLSRIPLFDRHTAG